MTISLPVRPPPTAPAHDVPADFDAGMTERWHAWQARGRAESARAATRTRLVLTAAAVVAAVVFGILRTR